MFARLEAYAVMVQRVCRFAKPTTSDVMEKPQVMIQRVWRLAKTVSAMLPG